MVVFKMRFPITSLFAILFLLLFGLHIEGFSQQPEPDTLKGELEPIRIEAIYSTISPDNAPLSLAIFNRTLEERNAGAALTMDEITGQLPGIWVNDRENYSLGERITIRGLGWRASFGVRGLQVIMDGIPLTVADGQAMLNSIDPSFVSKVELIRGPASTFWGNSSGGVLHLSSFSSTSEAPVLKLRSSMGSHGLFKQDARFSQSYGNHRVSAFTSYMRQSGYRDHSSVRLSRTGLKGTLDLNTTSRLEYVGAFVAMPYAEHPSGLTKEQAEQDPRQANTTFADTNAGKEVYQGQFGLNYFKDASLGFITLTGYGIYRDLTNPLPFNIIDLNRWAGGLRGTLEQQFNSLKVNAGFDLKLQHDDRIEYESNDGARGTVDLKQLEVVTNQALFVTSTLDLGRWKLLAGLRYDWLTFSVDSATTSQTPSRTFNALSPSIGISHLTSTNKWFANLSTSFEAPTTTELVNSPTGGSGFNPDLEPERTVGVEFGTQGSISDNIVQYDLSIYRMWIEDILFPYQLEANGPTFYRNQGNTIHSGIEARISLQVAPALLFNTTYTYTYAIFDSDETSNGTSINKNNVPGIPDHRLVLSMSYRQNKWLGELSYSYVGQYFADNLNTAKNNDYATVNAKVSLVNFFGESVFRIQPYINVNNIFDINYNGSIVPNAFGDRYFEPAAGRNFQAGFSLLFN